MLDSLNTVEEVSGLDIMLSNITDRFFNPFLIFPYLCSGLGFYLFVTSLKEKNKLSKNYKFWAGLVIVGISVGGMMIIITKGKL